MNRCLVLFVEGDTEIEFYKRVIAHARQKKSDGRLDIKSELKNVNGVGGFKNIALRKFLKEVKPKYGDSCRFSVVLCRDTDVFEMASKPPVDWKEVEDAFRENGVQKVIHIKAKRSIEDWFLHDLAGILAFLRLPGKTKVSGANGCEKLKKLFKQANKVYYKGIRSNGMIEQLDIDKIVQSIQKELEPLYRELGIRSD